MSSNVPRFQRTTGRQVTPLNPAAGAEFGVLAQELERFSAQKNAELDKRAEESGGQSGLLAGSKGEFEQSGSARTIRGRAFNRGVIVAHQAALQTDIRDTLGRYEIAHEADPDTFNAKASGLHSQRLLIKRLVGLVEVLPAL